MVFPTAWDRHQLPAFEPQFGDRYDVELATPADESWTWDLDVVQLLDEWEGRYRDRVHGVMSSSDYPGSTMAGALATRLGLPGTPPERLLRCAHKYYSRLAQLEAAPEAVPEFRLVRPDATDLQGLPYPCWIKPVKGAFSVHSGRLDSSEELARFLGRPECRGFLDECLRVFQRFLATFTTFDVDGRHFLAESYLPGTQVTVEGWVQGGEVQFLGIVDSVMHPGTKSFARFDYPSLLPDEIQEQMKDVVRRVVRHLGLDSTLFNVELNWQPTTDAVHVIEINPRMCGQFSDLYARVDGTSGHEVALAVAAGDRPRMRAGAGDFRLASSFPLRVFRPSRVVRAPTAEEIAAVETRHPGVLVWSECETGQELSDFQSFEDGSSSRYAIVNVGAETRAGLRERRDQVLDELGFVLEPLA